MLIAQVHSELQATSGIPAVSIVGVLLAMTIGLGILALMLMSVIAIFRRRGSSSAFGFVVLLVAISFVALLTVKISRESISQANIPSTTVENRVNLPPLAQQETHAAEAEFVRNESFQADDSHGIRSPEQVRIRVAARPDATQTAWASSDLSDFNASLYASIGECGEPLARSVAERIESESWIAKEENGNFEAKVFLITSTKLARSSFSVSEQIISEQYDASVNAFIEAIRKRYPLSQVIVSDDDSKLADPTKVKENSRISLELSLSLAGSKQAEWGSRAQEQHGHVSCIAQSAKKKVTGQKQFVDKPWVSGFDQVVSQYPEKQYVVGYSEQLASTEVEARESAMRNAQSQVRIGVGNGSRAWLDESHVVDRFAQKLSRPYGDVWREAVLVDLTGQAMHGTAVASIAQVAHVQRARLSVTFTGILLLLATLVVCFLANILTQGYYRGPVNWGTGALGSAIVLGTIYFMGRLF